MKQILLMAVLMLVCAWLSAQVEIDPRASFEDVRISRGPEDIEIQIKAMIPDISMVQIKSDTYLEPGDYKYTISLEVIREESKTQLTNWQYEINNWLEESK